MHIRHLLFVIQALSLLLLTACGGAATPPNIAPPQLADSGRIAEAEQFATVEGMANIYVGINQTGVMQTHPMLAVRSEDQQSFTNIGPLGTNALQNFSLSPGEWRLRIQFDENWNDPYLLSEFDLIVEENSTVLIDCSKDIGSIRYVRESGPVLRRFEDSCPEGVSVSDGVGACQAPYEDEVTSLGAILNEGAYFGACKLVDDPQAFSQHKLVQSFTDSVTNTDWELERAQQRDTVEGWQEFLEAEYDSEYADYAMARIAELQVEQEQMAHEEELQAILQRDSVLPPQAQRDKYMIALTGYLQNQDFAPSLQYFELLDRMNIELPDSLTHFWGEALLRTGDPQAAIDKLYQYISATGTTGTYYRDALALVNEAEATLAAQQAAQAIEVENLDNGTDGDFSGHLEVSNRTGYDIYYLYVGHNDDPNWGEDWLGNDILRDGDSFRVELDGYPSSLFDVKAEDEDGDTYTLFEIDVRNSDLTLTLSDLD